MARLESTAFADRVTQLVFMACSIEEAERVEDVLTNQGIDFVVELEQYMAGIFMTTARMGVGFHVLDGQAKFVRALLHRDFKAGVVEEPHA